MARGKLLFVAPSAYPLGGVQVWLDYIMTGLRNAGWEVELALTSGRHHDVAAYRLEHPFAPAHSVAAPTGTRQGRIEALRDCFIALRPDIVVGVNIADVYAAVATVRRAGHVMRTVATLHGLQPDFLADFQACRAHIDAVISTNRLSQKLVGAHCGLDEERVLYAPYGVEPCAVSAPDAPSTPFKLAYVGRIEEGQKRINDLIDVLARACNSGLGVELIVAGGGPHEMEMRAHGRVRGVEDRIRFLGVLTPDETRAAIYTHCDGLIITSSWETGPIVAWEAMAHGLPVLTSAYIGHGAEAALVDGENCLIFPVGGIEVAVEKLRMLGDPPTRRRLVEGGRNLVTNRYTREASIAQWDAQLRKVIGMAPRVASPLAKAPANGRLDRLLGAGVAEFLRRRLGRSFPHDEPGGEWPHAYGVGAMSEAAFWSEASRLDTANGGMPLQH